MKKGKGRKKMVRVRKDKKKFFYKEDIFISRMSSILKLPHPKTKELFYQRIVSVIRINNLVAEPTKVIDALKIRNIELKEIPWSPYTYIVKNLDKSNLAKTPEYKKGLFYIQNLSSMIPAIALKPTQSDIVLDMCAAPGSKTTQLASLMNNQGKIIANDSNFERSRKLSKMLKKFNVKNTSINFARGEDLGNNFPNYFDKVLLDAPCSGEGMVYLAKKQPVKFWSIRKSKEMSKIQKQLILSAYQTLKSGGLMVYSTCTLSPNENEGVVSYLLEKVNNAEIVEIDLMQSKEFEDFKPFIKHGLKEWNEEVYNKDIGKTIRIVPGKTMIAFYIALIRKN
jgi:tRNA (cytosine49-C5)-methyltransferase